jgi:hypothetical protein
MSRTLLLAFVLATPSAFGDEPKAEDVNSMGKPKDYKVGASTRYALWQDAEGWHFRMTTASEVSVAFTGTIRVVGGRISTITSRGSRPKDDKTEPEVKKGAFPAYNFSVKIPDRYEGGIDFTLDDKATALQCEFKLNGKEVSPKQIYLGAKGEHPQAGTFRLAVKKE